MFNKENSICCCIFTIIAGLLVGVGVAAVFFTGIVSAITVLFYITLILGLISLILITFLLYCKRGKSCFCINSPCLITSILGSIVSSIFALTITTIATFSIPVAILVGVVAFFLITTLVNITTLIICLLCNSRCE